MAREITLRSVLEGRNSTYGMLARLYRSEVDAAYLEKMRAMRCPINTGNADVDAGYKLFHSYLNRVWERSLEDLSRDYLRVFIGSNTTGHAAAYPNESVHTSPDRLVMQDSRDEVMAAYRAAGLLNDDVWKAGEDHIAVELEYMQITGSHAVEEVARGNMAEAASILMAQHHFLRDHLVSWVPFLVNDMLKFAQTDFYRALAHLTRGFLEEDVAFLEEVLCEELEQERSLQGEGAAATASADVAADAKAAEGEVAGGAVVVGVAGEDDLQVACA